MAVAKPWITPEDVKEYTSHKEVSEREDEKLVIDIARAEAKVIRITNNQFDDYEELPEPVRIAAILLAEAYAKNGVESTKKRITSETFDDYSYTAEASTISEDSLDLDDLLSPYILATGRGKAVMRLRRL